MVMVYTGGGDLMDTMFNSEITSATKEYVMSQFSDFMDTPRFSGIIKNSFDKLTEFTSHAATRLRESVMNMVDSRWTDNIIRELKTLGDHQQAKSEMQRWLMASTDIRMLLHEQRCAGYGNSYEDPHPGVVGKDLEDWRCVNTGIINFDDDTGEWVATSYSCEQDKGDEPLLRLDQRGCILNSWAHQRNLLAKMEADPTSPENNDL